MHLTAIAGLFRAVAGWAIKTKAESAVVTSAVEVAHNVQRAILERRCSTRKVKTRKISCFSKKRRHKRWTWTLSGYLALVHATASILQLKHG